MNDSYIHLYQEVKITNYDLGHLFWLTHVSRISIQCNVVGFLMKGHICGFQIEVSLSKPRTQVEIGLGMIQSR